jgi:hypothetical protein
MFEKTKNTINRFKAMFGSGLVDSVYKEICEEIEEAEKRFAELEIKSRLCMFCERPSIEKRLQAENERLKNENTYHGIKGKNNRNVK